ncbi:MAG TPA: NAD(P)-dependent oxidoreductase [Burkholderiales bacterium]|nr:NAD(P)-dependent oxidoreductase [Burkholderiales bacterium]
MASGERKQAVGVVGLGFIGAALAERLMNAGYEVHGFDVDASRVDALTRNGLKPARSALEIGRACNPVVVAVYDTPQVVEVVEGPHGLVEAAEGDRLIVVCATTCEPEPVALLARRASKVGISLIEFPLTGNSAQVRLGEALALVAGEPQAIADAKPVLDALCPARFEIGGAGDAARAKLAMTLVLQLNRCALAEGLVFAARMGLDLNAFLRVLAASPAHSNVMEAKGQKMIQGDYTPASHIAQTLRDAHLILEEARRAGQPLPLMEINTALLSATVELGGGERDSSAVIEAIRAKR